MSCSALVKLREKYWVPQKWNKKMESILFWKLGQFAAYVLWISKKIFAVLFSSFFTSYQNLSR